MVVVVVVVWPTDGTSSGSNPIVMTVAAITDRGVKWVCTFIRLSYLIQMKVGHLVKQGLDPGVPGPSRGRGFAAPRTPRTPTATLATPCRPARALRSVVGDCEGCGGRQPAAHGRVWVGDGSPRGESVA